MKEVPIPGADDAWELLSELDPEETARRSGARFEGAGGIYLLPAFGRTLRIDPRHRRIATGTDAAWLLSGEESVLFRLAVPWYLVHAKAIPPTGRLVRPNHLPGGDIFSRGTHVLPLDAVAKRFGAEPEAFSRRGVFLGASPAAHGDRSVVVNPFPLLPVTLILWTGDDEFPPRADLLLDATAQFQAPVDVLWAVAMMTTRLFLGS